MSPNPPLLQTLDQNQQPVQLPPDLGDIGRGFYDYVMRELDSDSDDEEIHIMAFDDGFGDLVPTGRPVADDAQIWIINNDPSSLTHTPESWYNNEDEEEFYY